MVFFESINALHVKRSMLVEFFWKCVSIWPDNYRINSKKKIIQLVLRLFYYEAFGLSSKRGRKMTKNIRKNWTVISNELILSLLV